MPEKHNLEIGRQDAGEQLQGSRLRYRVALLSSCGLAGEMSVRRKTSAQREAASSRLPLPQACSECLSHENLTNFLSIYT